MFVFPGEVRWEEEDNRMLGLFFLLQGRPFHLWLGKLPEAGSS